MAASIKMLALIFCDEAYRVGLAAFAADRRIDIVSFEVQIISVEAAVRGRGTVVAIAAHAAHERRIVAARLASAISGSRKKNAAGLLQGRK